MATARPAGRRVVEVGTLVEVQTRERQVVSLAPGHPPAILALSSPNLLSLWPVWR